LNVEQQKKVKLRNFSSTSLKFVEFLANLPSYNWYLTKSICENKNPLLASLQKISKNLGFYGSLFSMWWQFSSFDSLCVGFFTSALSKKKFVQF